MSIDGKVTGLNRPVFEALQKVKNPKEMSADEAKSLRSAIMQDGKVDTVELDLLQELTKGGSTIQVTAQSSAGFKPQAMNFAAAKGAAKDKLGVLTNPPNMNALWNGGAEGIKKLVDIYSIAPSSKDRVTQFVSLKLEAAWEASGLTNAFAPIAAAIASPYNAVKDDKEANEPGRMMLHESIEKLNARLASANKTTIPSFLYNWIRPGGVV